MYAKISNNINLNTPKEKQIQPIQTSNQTFDLQAGGFWYQRLSDSWHTSGESQQS